jgi:hypothetical protein
MVSRTAANFDLIFVSPQWFLCMFFNSVPAEIVVRISDLMFLEHIVIGPNATARRFAAFASIRGAEKKC